MQQLLRRHLLDGVRGCEREHVRELHVRLLLELRRGVIIGGVPDLQGRAVHGISVARLCQLHRRDVLNGGGGGKHRNVCQLHSWVVFFP